MKRKLDKNDEPSADGKHENTTSQAETQQTEREPSFAELGLDPRLVQAVAKQNFEKPTLVQRKAIPLALQGQDVLCKAKTGSGKTAAYVLPLLSSILKRKSVCAFDPRTCRCPPLHLHADLVGRPILRPSPRASSSSRPANSPTKSSKPSSNSQPSAQRTSTPPS